MFCQFFLFLSRQTLPAPDFCLSVSRAAGLFLEAKARAGVSETRNLATFFAWCVRREYLAKSPALALDRPRIAPADRPGIHTPAEVRRVLAAARAESAASAAEFWQIRP